MGTRWHDSPLTLAAPVVDPVLAGDELVIVLSTVAYNRTSQQMAFTVIGLDQWLLERFFEFRSHRYDAAHLGMVPLDLTATVVTATRSPVDPFP